MEIDGWRAARRRLRDIQLGEEPSMYKSSTVVWTLIVGWIVSAAYAQEAKPLRQMRKVAPPEERLGPGGFGLPGRVLPLMEALDSDKDGQLSKEEIEGAVAALKKLDKDNDGKLSQEEIGWPPMGRGMGGRGGPGGGPGGFGGPGGGPGGGPRGFGGPGGGRGPGGFGGGPDGVDLVQRIMSNDKDNDGKVTKDELPEFMQRMLERADTNKDGAIDKNEAKTMAETIGRGGGFRRGGRGGDGVEAPKPPPLPEGDGGSR